MTDNTASMSRREIFCACTGLYILAQSLAIWRGWILEKDQDQFLLPLVLFLAMAVVIIYGVNLLFLNCKKQDGWQLGDRWFIAVLVGVSAIISFTGGFIAGWFSYLS